MAYMGLGKTVQILAFLSGMFDADFVKHVILIVPTNLKNQWLDEFKKWTPDLYVKLFYGRNKKLAINLETLQRTNDVTITTYATLRYNLQQLSSYNQSKFVWDYIILDEAQTIKDPFSKTTMSCGELSASNRLLISGTPIQNNLKEMWALYNFACQGTLLGNLTTFNKYYAKPVTKGRERDATAGEKTLGGKISDDLMNIMKPFFLRRLKNGVPKEKASKRHSNSLTKRPSTEMPLFTRKNDLIIWVYPSAIQKAMYKKILAPNHIDEFLTTKSPLGALQILTTLCNHPRLLPAKERSQFGLKRVMLKDEALIEESGKLNFLIELLHKLREEGHRTIVFSRAKRVLDMVYRILKNKGFQIMQFHGRVTLSKRAEIIRLFQSDSNYSVLLLTTQVGSVGLTLTAADRVVIFDPSWNPATDAQAVDRVYRIGQEANVVIYRLITCGTVEECMYRQQVFKGSIIQQTTGDTKCPFRYFTKQELKMLFTLEDMGRSTTQIQMQNMHSSQRKTDTNLDEHIAYLHTLSIFGISDHDLIFANEMPSQDDECETEHEAHYIKEWVQKAHELLQMESQMNEQLIEHMRDGTEGACLWQIPPPEKPKERTLPNWKPVTSPPVVDLDEQIVNIGCHMDRLVIKDSSGDAEDQLPSSFTRALPEQVNGQVPNLDAVSDEHATEASEGFSHRKV